MADDKSESKDRKPRSQSKLGRVLSVAAAAAGLLAATGVAKGSVSQDEILKAQAQISKVEINLEKAKVSPLLLLPNQQATQIQMTGHVSHASHASHASHSSHRSSSM